MAWQWLLYLHKQVNTPPVGASWASCLTSSFELVMHNTSPEPKYYYILGTSAYGAWGEQGKFVFIELSCAHPFAKCFRVATFDFTNAGLP
jgi:hypothetical protein